MINYRFDLRLIAHRRQFYPTVGDYYRDRSIWNFRISRMGDERYHWLVFLHEMIEWAICRLTKVRARTIDRFDMAYEDARKHGELAQCGCQCYIEPGDDPHAPYYAAHQVATQCEQLIARTLKVDWGEYSKTIDSM